MSFWNPICTWWSASNPSSQQSFAASSFSVRRPSKFCNRLTIRDEWWDSLTSNRSHWQVTVLINKKPFSLTTVLIDQLPFRYIQTKDVCVKASFESHFLAPATNLHETSEGTFLVDINAILRLIGSLEAQTDVFAVANLQNQLKIMSYLWASDESHSIDKQIDE